MSFTGRGAALINHNSRNSFEDVKYIEKAVNDMPCNHILGLVLARLPSKPWHNCMAAEQGEFTSNMTLLEYREKYVDGKSIPAESICSRLEISS